MGGVYQDPKGQWFVWRSPFYWETQGRLVLDAKTKGAWQSMTWISPRFSRKYTFSPARCTPWPTSSKIQTTWQCRGGPTKVVSYRPQQLVLPFLTHTHHIYSSFQWIKGADNTLAAFSSRLTHLIENTFLQKIALTFLQKSPWRLLTIPPGCRRRLTSMLHSAVTWIFSHRLPKRLHCLAPTAKFLQMVGNTRQPLRCWVSRNFPPFLF